MNGLVKSVYRAPSASCRWTVQTLRHWLGIDSKVRISHPQYYVVSVGCGVHLHLFLGRRYR